MSVLLLKVVIFQSGSKNPTLFVDGSRGITSKTSASSLPSTLTASTTSNLCSTSYNENVVRGGSLPALRSEGEILSSNLKNFGFSDLKIATRYFRSDSLIGEGGFGLVYKGWLDEQTLAPSKSASAMVVAVKKLKPDGFQGHKEWLVGLKMALHFCFLALPGF